MKKILKFFISSRWILFLSFLINLAIFILLTYFIGLYVYPIISAFAFLIALTVLARSTDEPVYKISWLFIIVLVPLYGTVLYLYLKSSRGTRRQHKQWMTIHNTYKDYIPKNKKIHQQLQSENNSQDLQSEYLYNTAKMPVCNKTYSEYLENGEVFFKKLIQELDKAKDYIYLQYFIISPGKLWDNILSILESKAESGVEVKILYDDFGCIDRVTRKTIKALAKKNIEARAFNKIRPSVNRYINYRDHRKITIIDGRVAFTGGANIGDEYVNILERFGHWKDAGIMVKGDVIFNFLVLFASSWMLATKQQLDLVRLKSTVKKYSADDGFVQAFGTGPMDTEPIARNNYIRMINNAQKYIYITTPYLVIDGAMNSALKLCAKSGVDVRIIMPGIPDKKLVYWLGRSYYEELLLAGVKIYEYRNGFVHSKLVLSDDITACVGTINFDFRSLFLHFEDAVVLYNTKSIGAIKSDIESVLSQCKEISLKDAKSRKWYEKVIARILKLFAPLM